MTWLSEWLKEIIFIVLLSVFVDLLLPNRAMERYVKLVVGLLILLTLLSPILKLFSGDPSSQLEVALSDPLGGSKQWTGGQSTQDIIKQGELLMQKRESESLQLAGEELARQMKEQLQTLSGERVERVVVMLESEPITEKSSTADLPIQQQTKITRVEVYMQQAQTVTSKETPNQVEPITPIAVDSIAPVEVNVSADQDPSSAEMQGHTIPATVQTSSELSTQITEWIGSLWGVNKQLITVYEPE